MIRTFISSLNDLQSCKLQNYPSEYQLNTVDPAISGTYRMVTKYRGKPLYQLDKKSKRTSRSVDGDILLFYSSDNRWEINDNLLPDRISPMLVSGETTESFEQVADWYSGPFGSYRTEASFTLSTCGEHGEPDGQTCHCSKVWLHFLLT